jgi:hypothetical protein
MMGFNDSISWAEVEFQEQEAYELDCTWQRAQIKRIELRSFRKQATGTNSELDVASRNLEIASDVYLVRRIKP